MPRKHNIKIRRGTAAEWSSSNPILDDGEIGYDKTNNNIKIGDGIKTWASLSYTTGETGPASEALKLNTLTFNGSTTTFALASGSTTVYPASAAALIISLNGVVQEPDLDYTVSGSNITFAQAPTNGTNFFGISLNGIAAPITAASITSGTLDVARIPTGSTSSTVCIGNDARLSDTRTPTDGSVTTAKLADDNVTYAKLQNVSATNRLLGRSSAGAGDVEELDAATARTVIGVQPTASPAFTGAATFDNTGNVVPLTVTNTGTANSFVVNDASGDTTPFVITAGGLVGIGVTPSGSANLEVGGVTRLMGTLTLDGFLSSAPAALTFYDDTDTGLSHPSANTMSLVTNNEARLTIASTGTATFSGQVVGQAGAAISGGAVTVTSPLVITGTVAGNVRQLRMQTSGSTRWEVGPGFDAESGSNVGSTFWITRWSDSGVFLGTPIAIARATGNVTLENQLTVSSGMSVTGTVLVGISTAFDSTSNIQIGAASNPGIGIARTATPSNTNSIAGINGTAYDGAAYVAGGTINWRANENWSSTNHGTDIQFRATPAGSGGALTEVLRITGGGQTLVTAGSGSAGSYAPGIAISGDPDTGIQQMSGLTNTLSVVTAGNERLRVGSGGRFTFFANSEKYGIQLNNGATANGPFIGSDGADIFTISTAGGAERLRVDASGRVGIGVTPASSGSSAIQVRGDLDIFGNDSDRSVTYNIGVGDAGITGWYRGKIAFIPSGATNNISENIAFFTKDGDLGGSTLTERFRIAHTGTITAPIVYSDTVGATNRDLFVDSTGKFGYVSSIRESKTDIVTLDDVSWLSSLAPVSYRYRKRNADGTYSDEADGVTDYGLIAEDVEAVRPELCFYDMVDGAPQLRGVTYSKLITPMLRYIQQLEQRIAALEERLSNG